MKPYNIDIYIEFYKYNSDVTKHASNQTNNNCSQLYAKSNEILCPT